MRKKAFPTIRINIILYTFLILYLLVIFQLFKIQILGHDTYLAEAQDQYWDLQEIYPRRGNILSSDDYVLAGTSDHFLMYVELKKIGDKTKVANQLAKALSSMKSDKGDYYSYYNEKFTKVLELDLFWAVLERAITPGEKEKLEELYIDGIGFEVEPIRYYPEGTLASHILGYVAQNEAGEKTGYYGVEGMLDDDLKGRTGRVVQEVDATGSPILTGGIRKVDPIQGRDVRLTINRGVQYILEKKIKEGVEKYDAASGSVIVMDPFTGDVLGMANYPTFYPANFLTDNEFEEDSSHRKKSEQINLAIAQAYEPGSVIKPLTVSSAIDLNLVTPSTTFEDFGPVQYSDYTIDNWDGNHHGVQTVTQLLQKSNNIGAAWVGHRVGSRKLYQYFSDFGIGKTSEIELEGENTGILNPYNDWTDIDLATAAFGQGISTTPLQVLNGFNTLANGGYLLQPRIISHVTGDGDIVEIPTKNLGRVISKETSQTMIELLEEAASGGEAKYFVLKNYRIAGKTGTAQIPVGGKYDPEKTNATFVGFMAGSKRFSMIVKLEEPHESVYAAETAVPLWMEITQELVKIFGLPPDREIPLDEVQGAFVSQDVEQQDTDGQVRDEQATDEQNASQ